MELTEKQRAVVEHGEGPALVYAVAGAGKTTAMKHRIRRLVADGCAVPEQILAVSFAKANVQDLLKGLEPWPECRGAYVRTIHSLSLSILTCARDLGLPVVLGNGDETPDGLERRILWRALAVARAACLPFADELGSLDEDDFLDFVGAVKGNLRYADLAAADLPEAALRVATQAEAPPGLDWYLDLFRVYERVRRENAWVTFDDMLVGAWEALLRFDELLRRVQARFRYLLVDEFQDVNLAQVELLRLIAEPHDNYMAIGDDDQTIYEWRGASPTFIRDFARDHPGTTEYYMDDCFRCPAEPLALANAVIEHDSERRAKRLYLTRGFGGGAQLRAYDTAREQARAIAMIVERERAGGRALADMAILVRLTAQTPPLEQALLERHLPYLVAGEKPFFARGEVRTLLDYCLLAEAEAAVGEDAPAASADPGELFRAWFNVYNRPKRYVSRAVAEEIWALSERCGLPLTAAIERVAAQHAYERMSDQLLRLGGVLRWLTTAMAKMPAEQLLQQLQVRLGYLEDLRISAVKERGEQRVATVRGFIDYARGRGSLAELRRHLRELEVEWEQRRRGHWEPVLTISTIHRAKGLEWDVVFVPDCNEGIIPCASSNNDAEERRLLYVAITRAREYLYLSQQGRMGESRFLVEACPQDVLDKARRIARALSLPVEQWGVREGLCALCGDVGALQLHPYFCHFWPADSVTKAAAVRRIRSLYEACRRSGRQACLPEEQSLMAWREVSPGGWDAPLEAIGSVSEPEDGPGLPTTSPKVLEVGHWVRTDAGWSRIERMRTAGGVYVDTLPSTEQESVALEVLLRPGHDALRATIDLGAHTIAFDGVRPLYTCSLCNTFTSHDQHLITGKHNRAAHGGCGPAFRREPAPSRKLSRIEYRCEPPDSELV